MVMEVGAARNSLAREAPRMLWLSFAIWSSSFWRSTGSFFVCWGERGGLGFLWGGVGGDVVVD